MLRRENILITEDYMSKTTSATHFTAPGEIECFDSSIHFGKESDRVEIQNCNIKSNVLVHCAKDDTYDFEVGALIALMKMCGREKALKAVEELYNLKEPRGADLDGDILISTYEEEIKKLRDEIVDLDYRKTCNETTIELLRNTINTLSGIDYKYKELKAENEELHKEICSYERGRRFIVRENNSLKEEIKRLDEEKKHLEGKYERCQHILDARIKDKYRLEEENEKLKLDCEKLQHGYIDTDMIFCGGRQNGKQYTLLVDLFKKLDQKKVDEAYKEAYNTKLPLWQKEVFKQMCDIYEESKEKAVQIKGFNINIKPSTKRDKATSMEDPYDTWT